jgi:hypothetical protein
LHRASVVSKTLFIIPTDAHYYKSAEVLKQFKVKTLTPTCFGSCRNHHQGAVLCLAKTTDMFGSVLVDMDSVNAMAAYRPVVQACVNAKVFLIVLSTQIYFCAPKCNRGTATGLKMEKLTVKIHHTYLHLFTSAVSQFKSNIAAALNTSVFETVYDDMLVNNSVKP